MQRREGRREAGLRRQGRAPACHGPAGRAGWGVGGTWHSLGKVGQVLGDFGDEGECAGGAVIGVLLQQIEE